MLNVKNDYFKENHYFISVLLNKCLKNQYINVVQNHFNHYLKQICSNNKETLKCVWIKVDQGEMITKSRLHTPLLRNLFQYCINDYKFTS